MKQQKIESDSLLTSYQVGDLLQVNPSSVNKWVKDGRIPAFRTPGGHRRIRAGDLVDFLKGHQMPLPKLLQHAAKKRLLVVDDDPKQLEALQRLLKSQVGRVEALLVDNGIDALVQVGTFQPHVMVLDVIMPKLDGVEVCKRLQQIEATKHVKVIVTSANLTAEVEKKAKAAGAHMCIPKPIEMNTVLEALEVADEAAY